MPQIFHHSTNFLARLTIFGAVIFLGAAVWVVATINRSSWVTGAFVERQQPVQFSHKHHSGDDGIDCRYCHTSVETSASAGMPPTQTCMNCHSQIWADSPYLEPVRESYRTNKPIEWTRVHDLPDFVYFNHSIHVNKGVGCSTCHGNVSQMPLMYQASSLQMEWCLSCHRAPEKFVREKKDIFKMDWEPPANQAALGAQIVKQNKIQDSYVLTSCSTCHR
ncbi:MAG TPA: cytochrome c3 family protein [Pyrinomonadaceae bacterium]|nr:cytochrome c3 family protein [Pyrinomonadaceae bacterium]